MYGNDYRLFDLSIRPPHVYVSIIFISENRGFVHYDVQHCFRRQRMTKIELH